MSLSLASYFRPSEVLLNYIVVCSVFFFFLLALFLVSFALFLFVLVFAFHVRGSSQMSFVVHL